MKIIGITGPTGAGKTTVLRALEELGAMVIDCDAVYHHLLEEHSCMLMQLRQRFGQTVFNEEGRLDRKALGQVVFRDQRALADLNAITHQYVVGEIDSLLTKAEKEECQAVAVDAIALLESGLLERCHVTVAVTAPIQIRIERIMGREGISREYAEARIAAQKPDSYFQERCDYVFHNDSLTPADCKARARDLFQIILKEELVHE